MDIRRFTTDVSDAESPAGVLLFAERQQTDMKPVLQKMEFAFSSNTVIVGDGDTKFLCRSDHSKLNSYSRFSFPVALVFARDNNKPLGIGEIKFHLMPSTGLSPVGSTYKAGWVNTIPGCATIIRALKDTTPHGQLLNRNALLEEIYNELGDRNQYPYLYIGIIKRRNRSVGMDNLREMQFLEFHELSREPDECLFAVSVGIKTGNPFRFYFSSSKAAILSCQKTSDCLKHLKKQDKSEVFGGIIFSSWWRSERFLEQPGIYSCPFLENFPGVSFGGSYCDSEIGRVNLSLYDEDNEEGGSISSLQHFYSAFYLVMSYIPPPPPRH